jgi:sterol desaturase/sphingolipid hydroxylase (fatty acid hydroxylase superfamily)
MEIDLLAYRETLLGIAFYGTIGVVALWETVAEFRSPVRSPLVRWSNNIALGILGFALERWLLIATGLSAALYARHAGWGLLNNVALPEPVLIVLSVLFLDMLFYGIHRVWHAVPLLWRFHCVHHSDTEFDFSVGFRRHPVELLANAMLAAPLIIVLGVPVLAVVLFQILRAATLIYEHANVRLPERLDRFLRYFVVTPNMHRIHHSSIQAETDSNYSDLFPVWDRLFGSYRAHPAALQESMQFGLDYFREPGEIKLHRMLLQPARYNQRTLASSESP